MKFISILAQGLCVSILTACGSESSDTDTVESFNLSSYEGRVVSLDSLVGTWVYVKDGTTLESETRGSSSESMVVSSTSNSTSSYKEYFIIRESETGLEKSRCYSGFYDVSIGVNAEELYLESGHIATVTNNTFSGLYEFDDGFDNGFDSYYRTESKTFQGIKISDSVEPFGTITNTVSGAGSTTADIYCFSQEVGDGEASTLGGIEESGNYNFYTIRVGLEGFFDPNYHFFKMAGFNTSVIISAGMGSFYSDAGANVNFTTNEKSDLTYSMDYSASNSQSGGLDVSGFIQLQLPNQ